VVQPDEIKQSGTKMRIGAEHTQGITRRPPRSLHALLVMVVTLVVQAACASAPAPIAPRHEAAKEDEMVVRVAELEIEPASLAEYMNILREESEASIRLEPGVLCILPMQEKEDPNRIRIVEVYATKSAYESHLQTPHFKHYKTATQAMVKSLRLVDMNVLDPATMPLILRKVSY
jgi:quinol monooxygenase YgiN